MPVVTYISAQGEVDVLEGAVGQSVMEVAVRAGLRGIIGDCGGSLSCSTCHVFVAEDDMDKVPAITSMEDEMLDGTTEERQPNSRLSCQLKLRAGADICVTTPETQL